MLFFGAVSNHGANYVVLFPANHDAVICIRATPDVVMKAAACGLKVVGELKVQLLVYISVQQYNPGFYLKLFSFIVLFTIVLSTLPWSVVFLTARYRPHEIIPGKEVWGL